MAEIKQLSPESIQFLEANKGHWELWQRARYIQHLDGATREGLLAVVQKEFYPGYFTDLWCAQCVTKLLEYAYTQYEKWQKENSVNQTKTI